MSQLPVLLRALLSGLLFFSGCKCAKVPLSYRHKLLPSRVLFPPAVSTALSLPAPQSRATCIRCKCASVHMVREREGCKCGKLTPHPAIHWPQVLSQQAAPFERDLHNASPPPPSGPLLQSRAVSTWNNTWARGEITDDCLILCLLSCR